MRRAQAISLVAMLVVGLCASVLGAPSAAAADIRAIHAWVQLSATRPAVGCTINTSVEIRESGFPVASTEVALAIFVGDQLISADRAVTGSDGIAYLALDTSAMWNGANGWLDINIAGTYVGGASILPNNANDCSAGARLIELEAEVPVVTVSTTGDQNSSASGPLVSFWVPTYVQQRNLSCEYASLYIATARWGNGISEYAFDGVVGWSDNPHWGYRGNITGWWGNTTDYGVYAEPLSWALSQFGFRGDVFYALGDTSELTWRLDAGIPVLVWLSMWGDPGYYDWTADGTRYKLVPGMHVMVAYGYDQQFVYLSDPATGSYRSYAWGDFLAMWNVLDGMGLGVTPA
jgi:uncharacterized protein YvpB